MKKALCVGIGGGIGALLRYYVAGKIHERAGSSFPYGTMIINISGSFLIGLLMTLFLERFEMVPEWKLFLVVGILGGYTTFSAFTWEMFQLLRAGAVGQSALYMGGSVAGGFAGLLLGVLIGRSL
jgi:fluoride exporter